jgi:hypothetical protein
MKVYCELLLDQIRLKVNGDELIFQAGTDFYLRHMLTRSGIRNGIQWHLLYHQSHLNLFQWIKHRIVRNKAYILVGEDVQNLVTLRQIHFFGARLLHGSTVRVILKPSNFDSTQLEEIESIGAVDVRDKNLDVLIRAWA